MGSFPNIKVPRADCLIKIKRMESDPIITLNALVHGYLKDSVSEKLASRFKKDVNLTEILPKGSPTITDMVEHYQTSKRKAPPAALTNGDHAPPSAKKAKKEMEKPLPKKVPKSRIFFRRRRL